LGYYFYYYEQHFSQLKRVDPLTEASKHLNLIALNSTAEDRLSTLIYAQSVRNDAEKLGNT
jgi:hypothetical protein